MNNRYSVIIDDCIMVDGYLYYFAQNYNALFSLNINTKESKLIGRIPDESIFSNGLISNINYYKGKLYLTPKKMKENKIWVFDLEKYNWHYIAIDTNNIAYPMEKIAYATLFNNELIMIGCYYNGVIRVNLDTSDITCYKDFFDKEDSIHSLFYCLDDGIFIYIPSPNGNSVEKLNLITFEKEHIVVGSEKCAYLGICKCGNDYWLVPRKNAPFIVKWDGDRKFQEYAVPKEITENGEYYFGRISSVENNIYMIGGYEKKTFVINEDYSKCEILETSPAFSKRLNSSSYIMQEYNGDMNFVSEKYKINMNLFVEIEDLRKAELGKLDFTDVFIESTNRSLSIFIDLIK